MHVHIQAFVAACSACRHREPRRRSKTSKRAALRWFRETEDDGDSDEELLNNPLPVKSEDKPGKFPKGNKTLNRLQKLAPAKTDENWNLLVSSILRFIKVYKDNCLECLDLCLIPLRNSLTQATDFSPSYLLMGREPSFPESIIRGKDSADAEVALSQEQIEQSVDAAMSHYLQCSIPDIKQIILPEGAMDNVYEIVPATSPVRKSGRKTKKYHRLAGFDNPDGKGNADVENLDKTSDNITNGNACRQFNLKRQC